MKKFLLPFLLLAAILIIAMDLDAQCAMCKLNAKSASDADANIGQGINDGILYLMGVPYALLLVGSLVFFRKKIGLFK
ncbi:MAG: LPXTG-motif cell wall-anchored protein [Flavobacteriales bacterium]|jgi:LPXTG-motif cell wall-anchored protein